MKGLLGFLVVLVIVGLAYGFTAFWVRWAYRSCPECRALNLPRRTECRVCGVPFEVDA